MDLVEVLNTRDEPVARIVARVRAAVGADVLGAEDSDLAATVRQIIRDVADRGDDAVIEYTARFDRVKLTPDRLRVQPAELAAARDALDAELRKAIELAIENVRRFQQHILIRDCGPLELEGVTLRSRPEPLRRVVVCVPGGTAPLPSTAVMTVVPAQVAGVRQIALMAPPREGGEIHPVILATASLLGVDEVYRFSGAQGVAALALGTDSIEPVDKIVGPGHASTQIAKKMLFGSRIGIESFAGPSEVLIIADESADPAHVAADMLAQAEHDNGQAVLVTAYKPLVEPVQQQLDRLSAELPAAESIRTGLRKNCFIILTADWDQAVEAANAYAPEHLHVETREPEGLVERLRTAGAIFLGHYSPEATGDYVAGPSHVLPTGGTARFFSALCANDFLRFTSVVRYDRQALLRQSRAIIALARAERLDAHALSVQVRCR